MTRAAQSWRRFVLVAFAAASCARATGGATSPAEKALGAAQRPVQQAPAPATSTGVTAITWHTSATAYRGKLGQQLAFTCPAAGTAAALWGTGVYTDDSSICTAAVHAGVITLAGGGQVRVAVQAGEPSYQGSTNNGITSTTYGAWAGSIVIVGGQAAAPPPIKTKTAKTAKTKIKKITWGDSATTLRGKNGTRVSFVCPPHGTPSTVWGTTVYTDDSSICSAAVHAGHITRISGGRVTIEVRPGMQQYGGSAANGVTSQPYGQWAGSYVFP